MSVIVISNLTSCKRTLRKELDAVQEMLLQILFTNDQTAYQEACKKMKWCDDCVRVLTFFYGSSIKAENL